MPDIRSSAPMHDPVTGLFARAQFFKILHKQVRNANELRSSVALLLVEIQHFRKINAIYGYSAGDRCLQAFADVLKQVQRPGDYAARIGNDCFALLLPRMVNLGHAKLAAYKIQRLLEVPFEINGEKISCDAVIGLSICPVHATVADELLKITESAVDHAKHRGETLGVHENVDKLEISETWDLEYELQYVIERAELAAYFQPKIALTNGRLRPAGAEALMRWQSPSRGLVPPDVFIPLAERMGFIKPLTVWMLNSALRLSAEWPERWGDLSVSVNIPPKMVIQPDFVDLVLSAEKLWQKQGVTLCLEVLERSMVDDVDSTFEKLKELRAKGIKVSIDDFGTGYSSLAYFRDIPADELKIDRSFVTGLLQDEANTNIVSLIIDLAHRFGLSVVAEGVEDKETLKMLKKLGCDQAQGYVFGKPMSAPMYTKWLNEFGNR